MASQPADRAATGDLCNKETDPTCCSQASTSLAPSLAPKDLSSGIKARALEGTFDFSEREGCEV